jgi:predicted secreted protein
MKKYLLVLIVTFFSGFLATMAQSDRSKMFHLNKAPKKVSLKVGQKAYFEYRLHGSVGFYGSYEISDSTVLKMDKEEILPDNPNPPVGMTGADNAQAIYIFEALKPGTTKLTVKQLFRNEEKSKKVLIVTVK